MLVNYNTFYPRTEREWGICQSWRFEAGIGIVEIVQCPNPVPENFYHVNKGLLRAMIRSDFRWYKRSGIKHWACK